MLDVTFEKRDYLHPVPNDKYQNLNPYIIATTQRSGSTLLCEILLQTGICGQPGEYLSSSFIKRNKELDDFTNGNPFSRDLDKYVSNVFGHYHLGNGTSGIKITWDQMLKIENDLSLPFYKKNSIESSFKHFFKSSKIIFLTRGNTISQAISKYIATENNKWHQWDTPTRKGDIEFCKDSILKISSEIKEHNEGWLSLLTNLKLKYIHLTYEELCINTEDVVQKILKFLHSQDFCFKNSLSNLTKPLDSELKLNFENEFRKLIKHPSINIK